MAGEDEELIVKIDDEVGIGNGEDQVVVVDPNGLTDGTRGTATVRKDRPDDPIATLRAQLAERTSELEKTKQQITTAESIASRATQRAAVAEREATDARTQAAASSRTTVESGIAAAKAEADAAEEAYKIAFEAGNAGDAAKAQRRIARAEADLSLLQQAKADLGEPPAKGAPSQRQPAAADPIEQFIQSRTPPTQRWLRGHMEYLTDPRKNAKMQAAHYSAEGEGIALDSPEYFDHVETFLGLKKQADAPASPQPSQRRPTAPVAPVTPTAGGLNGGGGTEVRLTRGEADRATDGTLVWNFDDPSGKNRFKKGDPIGIQEMARRKKELTAQGKYLNVNIDGT